MTLGYSFSDYVVQIIAGLGAGAVLFLVAAGLTLVFGALRVINFAHGSLSMLGAYVTVSPCVEPIGFGNGIFWLVIILAALVVARRRDRHGGPLLPPDLPPAAAHAAARDVRVRADHRRHRCARSTARPRGRSTAPSFLEGGVEILDGAIPKYQFFFMALAVVVGARALGAPLPDGPRSHDPRGGLRPGAARPLGRERPRPLHAASSSSLRFFAGLAGALDDAPGAR